MEYKVNISSQSRELGACTPLMLIVSALPALLGNLPQLLPIQLLLNHFLLLETLNPGCLEGVLGTPPSPGIYNAVLLPWTTHAF